MQESAGGLEALRIQDFRNLEAVEIEPHSGANLFFGANAAGKTSLIEAIYVLSRGRSFRSRLFDRIVRKGAARYSVFGRVRRQDRLINAAIERHRDGTRVRVDGRDLQSLAPLSELLPAQILHPNSHKLLEGGPQFRRRFLDWGVFHVEPLFLETWQRYQRALRQRNAALRTGHVPEAWEAELAQTGTALDAMRTRYLDGLIPLASQLTEALLGYPGLDLSYRRGWSREKSLEAVLEAGRSADRERGYTVSGAHRADLRVQLEGTAAPDRASRGQQKLLVCALVIAQTILFQRLTERRPLLLVDDLPAELDLQRRQRLVQQLLDSGAQLFVTAIEPEAIPAADRFQMFHVEHGRVREVI